MMPPGGFRPIPTTPYHSGYMTCGKNKERQRQEQKQQRQEEPTKHNDKHLDHLEAGRQAVPCCKN